jgi:solute:Na+ symporter, SSS family
MLRALVIALIWVGAGLGPAHGFCAETAGEAVGSAAGGQPQLLGPLDWSIIALYFAGMLGIGWFFSRRASTADDYLLGGRTMSPWAVGLSLFATMLSTISYLAGPGEMIQHGPMYFTAVLSYPVIAVVVGWLLIPYFVRLPLTSAYEILESRLGVGVRMLGALFFLSLRLLWMAVIVEATVSIVLVPLLEVDESYAPYLCALLGLTTVAYTSMGGMRAVVWTDVAQTFVLLGGALVALAVITWQLGGVDGWWPTTWAANWDPPTFDYDPHARISLVGVLLATFCWYVFTCGSDQMAIQRYLSTRDAPSARRMFNISMVISAVVMGVLAFLGLALLAYFRAHPEMLGPGQSVDQNADQLFPRFIAVGLPSGLSGLVVAGLLAAAMSSLSSGLNSSCAVITVDFLDRFSGRRDAPREEVRRTRYVSWCVGLVVVLLSGAVGIVQGNLLEIAYKVTNLLVAPLFGLFFMALFVRWATSFGTFVGAAFGLVTVVAINYWTEITGETGISFLWAMPLGLLVQAGTGALASLAPIGRRRPMDFE